MVALDGVIDAESCLVLPAEDNVADVGLTETAVAATSLLVTVTRQVAFTMPTVTVTVAVPTPTAVTAPLWETVATAELLLVHAADVAAVASLQTTESVLLPPLVSVNDDCERATVSTVVVGVVVSEDSVPSPTMGSSRLQETTIQLQTATIKIIKKILFFILLSF